MLTRNGRNKNPHQIKRDCPYNWVLPNVFFEGLILNLTQQKQNQYAEQNRFRRNKQSKTICVFLNIDRKWREERKCKVCPLRIHNRTIHCEQTNWGKCQITLVNPHEITGQQDIGETREKNKCM